MDHLDERARSRPRGADCSSALTTPPAEPGPETALTIAERLDRLPLTRLHAAMFALCTVGLFADIAEVALSNALAAIFVAPPHNMPRGDLALLLASVFAGGIVGAPAFGAFADRFGRRRAVQAALVLVAAGSFAAAASLDLTTLTIARLVTGFAIGGYPPLITTYLTEILPPHRRGRMLLLCAGLGYLGAPAIIGVIRWLSSSPPLGVEAWRWSLALGGFIAAASAVLASRMPESPRWLAAVGRTEEAERLCRRFEAVARRPSPTDPARPVPAEVAARAGFRALVAEPPLIRRTLLLVGFYGLAPWATVAFPLLSAAVMVHRGFRLDQSLLFAALSMLGPTLGAAAASLIVDRLERRLSLILCAGTMIAAGIVFAESGKLTILILAGVAFNTAAATYNAVLTLYGAELLPTHLRASALTAGWSAGRVASTLAPLALLPLLAMGGERAMFLVVTGALVASALLAWRGPPGRSGRSVA